MPLHTWLLYIVTVSVVIMTPGPGMLLVMNHALRYGTRPALATIAGNACGVLCLMLVTAAGLGALLAASATAFVVLKLAGAAYLVYLGIRVWRAPATPFQVEAGVTVRPLTTLFRDGLLMALSNPKILLFFAALFPQFIDPHASQALQLGILASTHLSIELICSSLYLLGSRKLAPLLAEARRVRLFNRTTGGMFVGFGCLLGLSQR